MYDRLEAIRHLGDHLSRYLTITGLNAEVTYTYKRRCDTVWQSAIVDMHQAKLKPESILYAAIDANANLKDLQPNDLLYIGSQTQDRMFRGNGLKAKNFHHREMRLGHNGRTLGTHLASGQEVVVYVVTGTELKRMSPTANIFSLSCPTAKRSHPAYSIEQLILYEGSDCWSWNSKGPDYPELIHGLSYI